jgi:4-hydroxy-tetrahydrodipicolinate reductase
MAYRVIQWFTGAVARENLRLIANHPRLELVGAVVHHESKDGIDVGEIAGIGPLGVEATRDVDRALALEADCVLYNGLHYDLHGIARILRAGMNVITISGGWYPQIFPEEFEVLNAACRAGDVSFHGTGNMPGLITDALPLFMSGFSAEIRQIHALERTDHRHYASREVVLDVLRYGHPLEQTRSASPLAKLYERSHRQSAFLVSRALGVELEDFRLTKFELAPASRDLHLAEIDAIIPKGSVAGMRFELSGYVDGKAWYVSEVEHVVDLELGAGWRSSERDPEFVVRIDGTPSLACELRTTGGEGRIREVLQLNAARMINSIPAVCGAEPGIRTLLDLPPITAFA